MEATTAPATETRTDVYTMVTNKIIDQLNRGSIPWQQPWSEAGAPTNVVSKNAYKGINHLLLAMAGYERNLFLTYQQITKLGGKVKDQAERHIVISWDNPKPEQGNSTTETKQRGVLKTYYVFNVAQCENMPVGSIPSKAELHMSNRLVSDTMPKCPPIQFKDTRAFYDVVEDLINLPRKMSRKKDLPYYATLYRQMIHSTGHDSRLARKGVAEMSELTDNILYSKEDLVADIATTFLLNEVGLACQIKNPDEYANKWIEKLKADKYLIFNAARDAQQAIDFILGKENGKEPKETDA